jgi:energy-converting hydrogenase Eha subunit A
LVFWGLFGALGGEGFFFRQNIANAIVIAQIKTNSWTQPDWVKKCTWLIFPILSFCVASLAIALATPLPWLRKIRSTLLFYVYSFLVMVIFTIRPNRLLAFDYRTSILIPTAFLVFGLLIFRVPRNVANWHCYLVTLIAVAGSLAPLASPYLYQHAPGWLFVIPASILLIGISCAGLVSRRRALVWTLSVIVFSSLSYALVPNSTSRAWQADYRGYDESERISRAVKTIIDRLPQEYYPIFWINVETGRLAAEYRAVMCAITSHAQSAWRFPQLSDSDLEWINPRSRLILLTEEKDVTAGAAYLLGRRQRASVVASQDRLSHAGISYWITQLKILPLSLLSLREGFIQEAIDPGTPLFDKSAPKADSFGGPMHYKPLTLAESGIYQFELRHRFPESALRFGALKPDGKNWRQQSVPPIDDHGIKVSWFRLAVAAGETIHLAVEVQSGVGIGDPRPALGELTVLRDADRSHSVSQFNRLLEAASR